MSAEQSWEQWASANLARGCNQNEIRSIMLSKGLAACEADSMIAESLSTLENSAADKAATVEKNQIDASNRTIASDTKKLSKNIHLHNAVVIDNDQIELYAVENFLDESECAQLTELIRQHNRRSTTTGEGISDFRTSHTCDLATINHPLIDDIDRRMCQYMGIESNESEPIQGQIYEVGQEFKEHTDYFDQECDTFDEHIGERGQRSWTFMVYLNNTRDGGATDFPLLDLSIKPTAGTALIWNNRSADGSCNPHTLHSGSPVLSGFKAILTKWFRTPDANHVFAKEEHEQLPALTRSGFLLTDAPKTTYQAISDFYHANRTQISHEHIPEFIQGASSESPSQLIELPSILKAQIHNNLQPHVENWIGDYVEPTYVYGIREYKTSAVLKVHRDRLRTHVASAIVNIDQDTDCDWPLVIEDHFYRQHKLFLKPGQMLLYEGTKLRHGRPTAFQGKSYANVFVHYQLRELPT